MDFTEHAVYSWQAAANLEKYLAVIHSVLNDLKTALRWLR